MSTESKGDTKRAVTTAPTKKRRLDEAEEETKGRLFELPKELLKLSLSFSTLQELARLRELGRHFKLAIDSGVPLKSLSARVFTGHSTPLGVIKAHGKRAESVEIVFHAEGNVRRVGSILKRAPQATSLDITMDATGERSVDWPKWIGRRRNPLKALSLDGIHPIDLDDLDVALTANRAALKSIIIDVPPEIGDDDRVTISQDRLQLLLPAVWGPKLRVFRMQYVDVTLDQLTLLWENCVSLVEFFLAGDLEVGTVHKTMDAWLSKRPRGLKEFEVEWEDVDDDIDDKLKTAPLMHVAVSKHSQLRVFSYNFRHMHFELFEAEQALAIMESNKDELEELSIDLGSDSQYLWNRLVPEHCPKLETLSLARYLPRQDEPVQLSKWMHCHPKIRLPRLVFLVTDETVDMDAKVLLRHPGVEDPVVLVVASSVTLDRVVSLFLQSTDAKPKRRLDISDKYLTQTLTRAAFAAFESKSTAFLSQLYTLSITAAEIRLNEQDVISLLTAAPALELLRLKGSHEVKCDFTWAIVAAAWRHPRLDILEIVPGCTGRGCGALDLPSSALPPLPTEKLHVIVKLATPKDYVPPKFAIGHFQLVINHSADELEFNYWKGRTESMIY